MVKKHLSLILSIFASIAVLIGGCATTPDGAGTSGSADILSRPAFSAGSDELISYFSGLEPGDDSGVIAVLNEINIDVNRDGSFTTRYHRIYQIAESRALDDWASLHISWSPWYENDPVVRVRVVNTDGSEFEVTQADGVEVSGSEDQRLVLTDTKHINIPFSGARSGSIVEEEITVSQNRPFFEGGMARRLYLNWAVPVQLSRVSVEYPTNMDFKTRTALIDPEEVIIETSGGRTLMSVARNNVPAYPDVETAVPYDTDQYAFLAFTTGSSWQEVASIYAKMVEGSLSGYDPGGLVDSLRGETDEQSIINTMLYVRKTLRYTGILLGENSIRPTDIQTIVQREFGDCKDMAVFTTALLRALGIDAYVAVLNQGNGHDAEPTLPGLGGFNHAIAYAQADGKEYWLDSTSSFTHPLDLPLVDQGRWVLIAREGEDLRKTPESSAADNPVDYSLTITLNDLDWGSVEGSVYSGGPLGAYLRSYLYFNTEEERRSSLQNDLNDDYKSAELVEYSNSDPENSLEPVSYYYRAVDEHRAYTDDSQALMALMPSYFLNYLPGILRNSSPGERTQPYYNSLPSRKVWEIRILAPEGFEPADVIPASDYRFGALRFSITPTVISDTEIKVDVILDSGERQMSAAEFNKAVEGIQNLYSQDGFLMRFIHSGARLIQEEQFADGLDVYKRVAADNSGSAPQQRRLALAFLESGLMYAATDSIDAAIEALPDNALLYATRGFILSHDLVGRQYGASWDREGALEAYVRATELEPDNIDYWFSYAAVLERNGLGIARDSGADLQKAYETYRHIYDDLGEYNAVDDIIELAILLDDYDTAADLIPAIEDSDLKQYYNFVLDASQSGDGKLQSLIRGISSSDLQRNIVSSAIPLMQQKGRYDLVADMIEYAARGTSDVVNAANTASMFRRTLPQEEVSAGSEPENLALDFLRALISSDADSDSRLKSLLAPVFAGVFDRHPERFAQTADIVNLIAKRGGLTTRMVGDMIVSSADFDVSGNDDHGYIVNVAYNLNGVDTDFYLFMDRIDGELKIAGSYDPLSSIGEYLLKMIDDERLPAARWWLEKIVETSGLSDSLETLINLENLTEDALRTAAVWIAAADDDLPALDRLRGYLRGRSEDALKDMYNTLAWGYSQNADYEQGLDYAKKLYELSPGEYSNAYTYAIMLAYKGDVDGLQVLADDVKDDRDLERAGYLALSYAGIIESDYNKVIDNLRAIADIAPDSANNYNSLSWYMLFMDPLPDDIFDNAVKAYQNGGSNQGYILHTIAAVFARLNRPQDALALLQNRIDVDFVTEPQDHDWLILGYIAQDYGLDEYAVDAFQRIEKPADNIFDRNGSSWLLGQMALKAYQQ